MYTIKQDNGRNLVEGTLFTSLWDDEFVKYLESARRQLDLWSKSDYFEIPSVSKLQRGLTREEAENLRRLLKEYRDLQEGVNATGVSALLSAMNILHSDGYNGKDNPTFYYGEGKGAREGNQKTFPLPGGVTDEEEEDEEEELEA